VLARANCSAALSKSTEHLRRIRLQEPATRATIADDGPLLLSLDLRVPPEGRLRLASNPARDNDDFADLARDKAKLHLFTASEAFRRCIHINVWAASNNGAPQPPRATGIRHETESSSRGWLRFQVFELLRLEHNRKVTDVSHVHIGSKGCLHAAASVDAQHVGALAEP
jgi:hypothetical protein